MPCDPDLKLFLLKKVLTGPVNNAQDPLKNTLDGTNTNVEKKTLYPNKHLM